MPFFLRNHNMFLNGGQAFFVLTLEWLSHKLPIPLSLTQFKRMIFVLIYKFNCFRHLLNMNLCTSTFQSLRGECLLLFLSWMSCFFLIEKGLFLSWTFLFYDRKGRFLYLQYFLLLKKCLSRSFTILGKNIVVTYHQ